MSALVLSGSERLITGATISTFTALNDGTFLSVWTRAKAGGGTEIVGQIVNADGSTDKAVFQITESSGDGGFSQLSASALSNGQIVVAWTQNLDNSGRAAIKSRIFKADGTEGNAIVGVGSGEYLGSSKIASLANGYAVSYTSENGIRSVLFDAAGSARAGTDVVLGGQVEHHR